MPTSVRAVGVLSVVVLAIGPVAPVHAASPPREVRSSSPRPVTPSVVARGLHGPRQIAFGPHGVMYVAEAGQGGRGTCIAGQDGPACFGWSGSVTRVRHGRQHRVLNGLASLSDQGTHASPVGPCGIAVVGRHTLVLSVGLGAAPRERKQLPQRARRQLGRLLSVDLRTKKTTSVADLAAYEQKADPVGSPDSNPAGLSRGPSGSWLVADTGGDDVIRARKAAVRTLARFRSRKTGGQTYDSEPTDVVRGPDGAYYVSELTGFPYPRGAARIWRVVPGHRPKVWASGLTNLTSLAWDGPKLYAVQLADRGLSDGSSPIGSLRRVFPDSSGKPSKRVAGGLFAPYGLAIHHGAAYVSTGAVAATDGTVVKIRLS